MQVFTQRYEMKTVYLHMGLHKTGTSAIQDFCFKNRESLIKKNVDYCALFLHSEFKNHHPLAANLKRKKKKSEVEKTFISCLDEIERYIDSSICQNILFSSEVFCEYDLYEDLLVLWRQRFIVRPIIYLRRQDLMKEAVYNQVVKDSRCAVDIKSENHYDYDYYSRIKRYGKIFGNENLIVRPYEKEQFHNGGLIKDFLKIFDIDNYIDLIFSPKFLNASLTRNKIELLRVINLCEVKDFVEFNHWILDVFEKIDSFPRAKYFLSAADRTIFYNKFESDNNKLASEFLGKKCLFESFPSKNEDVNWNLSTPPTPQDFAELISCVWHNEIKSKYPIS